MKPAGRSDSSLRSLLYEAGVYGSGMVLARGLGIFLTPVLARSLDAVEFGVLDLAQTSVLLASMVLSLQLESAVLRYFQAGGKADRARLLSTALAMTVAAGAVLIVVAAIVAPFVRQWIPPFTLAAAAAAVLTGLMYTHALTLLRAGREASRAAVVIAVNTVLNLAGVIVIVGVADFGVGGVFAARVAADGATALGVLARRRKSYAVAAIDRGEAVRLLKFGAPLTPEGLLTFASANVGKGILVSYGTLADVGLLAVANRMVTILKLAMASLRQAWLPYAFSIADRDDANSRYAHALTGYITLSAPLLIGFILFSQEIVLVFAGSDYIAAQRVLPPVAAAAVIAGLPYIFNIALLLEEKTSRYTLSVVASFITTVVASFVLIPAFGIMGAATAGLATSLVSAGSMLYLAQRARRIPYNLKLLYGFVAGVTGLGLGGAFGWLEFSLAVRLPILAMLGLAAGGVLYRWWRTRQQPSSLTL